MTNKEIYAERLMAIIQSQSIPSGFAIKHRSESMLCLSDLFFKKTKEFKEPLQVLRRFVYTNLVGPFGW